MNEINRQFELDIKQGLKRSPKSISSKYFYDDTGSEIFQEIMDLPEYYLPEAESEIIQRYSSEITRKFPTQQLDLIELGAGDGRKMVHFIRELSEHVDTLTYFPLDISESILKVNEDLIQREVPEVTIQGMAGDYFKVLPKLKDRRIPRVIVFAGSTIGNFRKAEALLFLKFIRQEMKPGDFLVLGVDLKKNPHKILKAYNDPQGVTRRFNLNLLHRINRELDADFKVEDFDHYATYHPISGTTESFLVSLENQTVHVGEEVFAFQKNEVIQTEISQKYDLPLLLELSQMAEIQLDSHFSDEEDQFSWVLFKP